MSKQIQTTEMTFDPTPGGAGSHDAGNSESIRLRQQFDHAGEGKEPVSMFPGRLLPPGIPVLPVDGIAHYRLQMRFGIKAGKVATHTLNVDVQGEFLTVRLIIFPPGFVDRNLRVENEAVKIK
jgi:hypothetical protein